MESFGTDTKISKARFLEITANIISKKPETRSHLEIYRKRIEQMNEPNAFINIQDIKVRSIIFLFFKKLVLSINWK